MGRLFSIRFVVEYELARDVENFHKTGVILKKKGFG